MESNNETTTCEGKDKQNSIVYDIKGEEKTPRTLKKKKRHGIVMFIYMNAVKYYAIKLPNKRAQHRKRPSVR